MQRKYFINNICILALTLFITIYACGEKQSNWPNYVTSSLLVPGNAIGVKYYMLGGSYQVTYMINECFPCPQFIEDIARTMISNGWKRLDYDHLNPKTKLNHISLRWDHYLDKNYDNIYQWTEDYENSNNDIVRYGLRYNTKKIFVNKDTCNLEVVEIYIPKTLR